MASPRTRFCETDSGRARGATQLSQLEQHREHAFQFSVEMNLVAGEAFEPVRIRLRQMPEHESMGGARVLAGDAEAGHRLLATGCPSRQQASIKRCADQRLVDSHFGGDETEEPTKFSALPTRRVGKPVALAAAEIPAAGREVELRYSA